MCDGSEALNNGSILIYYYDDAQRLTGIRDSNGNQFALTLDNAGNVLKREVRGVEGKLVFQRTYWYDPLGRLEKTQRDPLDPGYRYQYDRAGNRTAVTDPLGHINKTDFDIFDRPFEQTLPPAFAGEPPVITSYKFNHQDLLTEVADPRNRKTRYKFDGLGRLTELISPDTGTAVNGFDDEGNIQTRRDGRGETTAYKYDAVQRPTQIGRSTFSYGAAGTRGAGKLSIVKNDSGVTSFLYDALGRLEGKKQSVRLGSSIQVFTLQYGYGTDGADAGHLTTLTYPSGNLIRISYGSRGLPRRITVQPPGVALPLTIMDEIEFLPFGPVQAWMWGGAQGQPSRYSRQYDSDGRLLSFPLGHPMHNGIVRPLDYDANGLIRKATHSENLKGASNDQAFGYDDLGRLISFDAANTSHGFKYDLSGNRISARFGAFTYMNSISLTSNQLTRTTGPQPAKRNKFDNSGNLIDDATIKYEYSPDGRMDAAVVSGKRTSYHFNGLGQRIAKSQTGKVDAYYFYDESGRLVGEYDAQGTPIQETIFLENLPVAVLRPGIASTGKDAVFYVFADQNDTPRVITRASDNRVVWRWDEGDPFGLHRPNESPDGKSIFTYNPRFPGQIFDKENNNHYNYFRDYDPLTGRYVQSDPIGLMGGINTYAYAESNPASLVDAFGLAATKLINTEGGRSKFSGPTNGNWGGKCWSGGQYSCRSGGVGSAPPIDSADACYMSHDICYTSCTGLPDPKLRQGLEKYSPKKMCILACDNNLLRALGNLPDDSSRWPMPPPRGTESDSENYRAAAIKYFGK